MHTFKAFFALLVLLLPGAAFGQALPGGGDAPLEIYADSGIEWRREERVYVARGNARAVQGEVSLRADELRAYYAGEGGSSGDIHRVEAVGGVVIESPDGTAYGELGVYDVATQVMVLSGGDLRLVTATDVVTATQSLEYWQAKDLAVARGDAEVLRTDPQSGERSRIRADVMTATFGTNAQGKRDMTVLDAFDAVEITTRCEFLKGDRAQYLVNDRLATLTGNVKITRGSNQLNGDEAEVNMATGVSTLRGNRVAGLLIPNRKDQADPLLPSGCEGGMPGQGQ